MQVRFCGETEFAGGIWVGIELDDAVGRRDESESRNWLGKSGLKGLVGFRLLGNGGGHILGHLFPKKNQENEDKGTKHCKKEPWLGHFLLRPNKYAVFVSTPKFSDFRWPHEAKHPKKHVIGQKLFVKQVGRRIFLDQVTESAC